MDDRRWHDQLWRDVDAYIAARQQKVLDDYRGPRRMHGLLRRIFERSK